MADLEYPQEHVLPLEERERQIVLLALGHLAAEHPGWEVHLREIAQRIDNPGTPMFESFRRMKRESL